IIVEFVGAINPAVYIGDVILITINIPTDFSWSPLDSINVVSRDIGWSGCTIVGVSVVVIQPMNGAVDRAIRVDVLKNVNFTASGPTYGIDIATQHPESRPHSHG